MKKFLGVVILLALIGFLAALWIFAYPATIPAAALASDYRPDLKNGEAMFNIGGCAACHQSVGQKDRLKLGGGLALASPFGIFHAPNISPDPVHGIGGWSELQFANAILRGVGHRGENLYPALPYTSYQRMKLADVRDLHAFLKTLPPQADESKPHEIGFPFNIRLLLGGWKWMFLDGRAFAPDPAKSAAWNRGAYLVEGPGHCAECHSPRNALGAIDPARRFAGAPALEGKGWIPNITHGPDGIGSWTAADIADFLDTGMTPDFDSAGGSMGEVIQNTSRLGAVDRAAMAAYLVSLPALPGKPPASAKK